MAATLGAFRGKSNLWRSDWLKLLSRMTGILEPNIVKKKKEALGGALVSDIKHYALLWLLESSLCFIH